MLAPLIPNCILFYCISEMSSNVRLNVTKGSGNKVEKQEESSFLLKCRWAELPVTWINSDLSCKVNSSFKGSCQIIEIPFQLLKRSFTWERARTQTHTHTPVKSGWEVHLCVPAAATAAVGSGALLLSATVTRLPGSRQKPAGRPLRLWFTRSTRSRRTLEECVAKPAVHLEFRVGKSVF